MTKNDSDKEEQTGDSPQFNPLETAYIGTAGASEYLKLRGKDISTEKLKGLAKDEIVRFIRAEGGNRPYLFKLAWLEKYLEETQQDNYVKPSTEQAASIYNEAERSRGDNETLEDSTEVAGSDAPSSDSSDNASDSGEKPQSPDSDRAEESSRGEAVEPSPSFRQAGGARMQFVALAAIVLGIATVFFLPDKIEQVLSGNATLVLLPLVAAFITIVLTMVAPSEFFVKYKTLALRGAAALVLLSSGLGSYLLINQQSEEDDQARSLREMTKNWEKATKRIETLEKELAESTARVDVHQSWMSAIKNGLTYDDADATLIWSVSVECMPGAVNVPTFSTPFPRVRNQVTGVNLKILNMSLI